MRSPRSKQIYPGWIGIALAFYAFVAIGIAEGGLGVLLPSILETYHLTPATITLLFLSQVAGYIVAALSSSLLSNRVGLARMLLLASTILTSALCVYALSPYWLIMVASGPFLGLGIGLIDAGINTYIADDQRNSHLMGTLHAFYGIGSLLGPTIDTTLLALDVSWRIIYLIFAGFMGLLVAGMSWAVLHNYKPMTRKVTVSDTDAGTNLRVALKMPIVLVAGLLLLVYVGIETSLGDWAYSVQALSRNTPGMLAGYSVSAYWMGLTLGRFGMGPVINRWGAVPTLNAALVLLTVGLMTWWLLPDQLLSLPMIGLALGPIFPTVIWLMPKRIPTAMVPAAIGFMTSAASLGAATIPSLLGWIADRATLGIIPALLVPLAALMVLLHYWLVQRAPIRVPDDLSNSHGV